MENEAVQPVTLNIPGGRLSGEWTLSLSPPGGSSRAWTSPSSNGVDPPSFFMPQDSPKFARRTNGRSNKGSSIFGSAFKPTNEELTYLEAAEYGDIPTVKRMVEGSRTLNVNCVDYMGQNALQLACGNEHLEVVEILIKQPAMARIGDALLLAISRGYLRIVEIILNHPAFEEQDRLMCSPCEQRKHSVSEDHDFYAYDDDGTRFSPDITPVILAAQCQEFDIVHDLLRRGARITQPHHYRCLCRECSFRRNHDSLSHCLSRLNAFKGLASPAYLSLANPDPVLAALKLSHSLTTLANVEKEFKNDYLKLATQCNDFVEKLLDLCRDTEEVDAILDGNTIRPGRSQLPKYKANKSKNHELLYEGRKCLNSDCTGDTESNPKLCQLKLAMKYKVKKFVAHPNCQQKLMGIWNKEVSWMRQLSIFYKTLLALGASLLMPVLSLIYIFVPYSKVGRILQSPICKFALQAIAYVQFVTLLMINCLDRMESFRGLSVLSFLHHQHEPTGRHTKFNWCEIIIMIYILGLLWNELKELWQLGPRAYICQLWNIIDFFMLLILITSFTSRAIAYMKASVGQRWWTDRFGDNATIMHYNVTSDVVTLHGHPVAQGVPTWAGYYAFTRKDRSNWHSSDPELVAEAFYSYGLVLSFSRICYILEVNEKFGPLQISLARTVTDIIKWCGIFFIIFGSFMLGLYNLYSSYAAPGAKKNKSFTTIEETFITLFWSMFGLADYRGVEVNYDHELTRIVGYQLYGAYNIVTVVVMLNMLIAMINSSYAEVEHDSDVEWKFARAELMLSYFERGQTLPVPYNLIPVPRAFTGALSCAFQCFGKHSFKRSSLSGGIGARGRNERRVARAMLGGDHATGSDGERQQDSFMTRFSFKVQQKTSCTLSPYETLICGIVKRFVLKDQVENTRNAEITEAELQEIKHDISSLRFELLGTTARYEEKINTLIRMLEDKGKIPRSLSEQVSYSTCIKGQRAVPPNNLKVTGAN